VSMISDGTSLEITTFAGRRAALNVGQHSHEATKSTMPTNTGVHRNRTAR
jgi:hypothetical protein